MNKYFLYAFSTLASLSPITMGVPILFDEGSDPHEAIELHASSQRADEAAPPTRKHHLLTSLMSGNFVLI